MPLKPEQQNRYYLCSLPRGRLTDDAWLELIRRHWGVENGCHKTSDQQFREDAHPWIDTDPQGMLVVLLLRRLAYNLLALYRSVTLRAEERRATPWLDLMAALYAAMLKLSPAHLRGLRTRVIAATADA
jgi:hypothetical protein